MVCHKVKQVGVVSLSQRFISNILELGQFQMCRLQGRFKTKEFDLWWVQLQAHLLVSCLLFINWALGVHITVLCVSWVWENWQEGKGALSPCSHSCSRWCSGTLDSLQLWGQDLPLSNFTILSAPFSPIQHGFYFQNDEGLLESKKSWLDLLPTLFVIGLYVLSMDNN